MRVPANDEIQVLTNVWNTWACRLRSLMTLLVSLCPSQTYRCNAMGARVFFWTLQLLLHISAHSKASS